MIRGHQGRISNRDAGSSVVTDPNAIYAQVLGNLRERQAHAQQWQRHQEAARWQAIAVVVTAHPGEAHAFAQSCLTSEALNPTERARRKHAREEAHRRAYMRKLPPTERQIHFLRRLGDFEPVLDRLDAADRISQLVTKRALS